MDEEIREILREAREQAASLIQEARTAASRREEELARLFEEYEAAKEASAQARSRSRVLADEIADLQERAPSNAAGYAVLGRTRIAERAGLPVIPMLQEIFGDRTQAGASSQAPKRKVRA